MINSNHLVTALTYFLLVVVGEVALFYLVQSIPEISQFAMPAMIAFFLGIAWLLKLRLVAVIVSSILIVLYGILSFYSDFPIYHVGYPQSFQEFLPVIAIKTGYYTFPLIAYIAIGKK